MIKHLFKKTGIKLNCMISITVLAAFLLSSGCGTLIYPERRGQNRGRIDPGIAVLDGVGLLLFIIPGLVAFTVDFATGAIYLPGGGHSQRTSLDRDKMKVVRVNPKNLTRENIIRIVKTGTGITGDFNLAQARIYKMDVKGEFVEASGPIPDILITTKK
jgi:hypothetical protein